MDGTRWEDYGACFFLTSRLKDEKIIRANSIHEEVLVEEVKPMEVQPLEELMNGLFDDDIDDVPDSEEDLLSSRKKSDPEIFTSFLTIDVAHQRPRFSSMDLKHRGTLHDLFTTNNNTLQLDHVDGDTLKERQGDLNMITKYLNDMPLDANHWPQNYDVVRDLAKVYLSAKNSGSEFLSALLDYFVKLKWPDVFTRCLSKISESFPQVFLHSFDRKINFEDPTPETLNMRVDSIEYSVAVVFHVFLLIALELTETHIPSVDACCESGLIRFLFKELFPKMHGISWGRNTAREEFVSAAMDIVYNCAKGSSSFQHYIENGAIEALVQFRKETEYVTTNRINISALLALSYLIEERTNHLIITDPAPFSVLVFCINECLAMEDHCYGDFTAVELLDGLTRIISHDVNKIMFCDQGGLGALSKVFEDVTRNEEFVAACRLLWSLCLLPKCRQMVRKRSAGIQRVLRFQKRSQRGALLQFMKMVLWEIEEKFEPSNPQGTPTVDNNGEHIYISADSEHQGLASDIACELIKKGYRVWDETTDREDVGVPVFVEAVNKAAVVIVCVSRKYKQLPEYFAVADYAFQTRKLILPVIIERSYRPDGWLGLLVASKPWIDFSLDVKFSGSMNLLSRQLGEKGKSGLNMNTLLMPRNAEYVQNGYFDREQQILHDVATWSNDQVVEWLAGGQLLHAVKEEKLKKLRGAHLIRLNQLRKESPDFYYSALEPQLGFTDVLDMLEFTEALEKLTECHL